MHLISIGLIDTFSFALLNMDIILFHYYERDMEVFFVSDGKFTVHYDSPYHGDYELAKDMTISSDGNY